MNAITTQTINAVPARLADYMANNKLSTANSELSAGVTGGFAVMSIRGKAFHIKHRGEERTLMREDGDGARGSVEVVILKSAPVIGKIFYEAGYEDGSNAAPDCFSTNGQTPDAVSPKKQNTTCAACPKNIWGSKVTPQGKPGKACADSRRLAIVPAQDILNDAQAGPMLLRIPAASLGELATYSNTLNAVGHVYFGVVTRISFDTKEAFPKLVFNAVRPLADWELDLALPIRDDARTARVLSEELDTVQHQTTAPPSVQSVFEQPPVTPVVTQVQPVQQVAQPVQQVAQPVQQVAQPVQQVAQPVQQVAQPVQQVAQPVENASMGDDLDALLDQMMAGKP
jgi:hypothetical protein